jgi:hypothetical protein
LRQLFLSLLLACALRAAEPGLYIWNGLPGRLAQSVRLAEETGFNAVRLVLSPASRRIYGLAGLDCANLTCLVNSEAFQGALAGKSPGVVMFTAYDFASYRGQRYLDLRFLASNRERIFDEYRNLTEDLMRRFAGSGRVFIIGHWEGDNQVYCGSSFDFVNDEAYRGNCLEHDPEAKLAALTEWLRIRQSAVAAGRERAKANGAAGVEVYHAIEFNSIHHFSGVPGVSVRSKNFHGVLDTSVPAVHPDFCSYSAWESLNRDRLGKDLRVIVDRCAPAPLIVGEMGFRATRDAKDPAKRYAKAIDALRRFDRQVSYVSLTSQVVRF